MCCQLFTDGGRRRKIVSGQRRRRPHIPKTVFPLWESEAAELWSGILACRAVADGDWQQTNPPAPLRLSLKQRGPPAQKLVAVIEYLNQI
jgi:hypothetical protein